MKEKSIDLLTAEDRKFLAILKRMVSNQLESLLLAIRYKGESIEAISTQATDKSVAVKAKKRKVVNAKKASTKAVTVQVDLKQASPSVSSSSVRKVNVDNAKQRVEQQQDLFDSSL